VVAAAAAAAAADRDSVGAGVVGEDSDSNVPTW